MYNPLPLKRAAKVNSFSVSAKHWSDNFYPFVLIRYKSAGNFSFHASPAIRKQRLPVPAIAREDQVMAPKRFRSE